LAAFPDLQIVAEANTGAEALEMLESLPQDAVDLLVLELACDRLNPNLLSGLSLCQHLKAEYPNLPVLLLTAQSDPFLLQSAKQVGLEGYCPKGIAIAEIVQAIRLLVSGQVYWQMLPELPPVPPHSLRSPSWHHQLRSSGLRQIEATLALVTQELQKPNLSNFDWVFWSGRRRELLAARWVVNQLLPTDVIVVGESEKLVAGALGQGRQGEPVSGTLPPNLPKRYRVSPLPDSPQVPIPQLDAPFGVTLAKLQSGLLNLSGIPLEIDILATEKKRDLLYIVLQKIEDILQDLRFSQVTSEQLSQKRSPILLDLWQASLTDFLGKYYTLPLGNQDLEVVNVLLGYAGVVQTSTLDKIPLVIELFSHQLFATPLMIDNIAYSAQSPEALARAELLLQNIIIQAANAVIQPLLNEFSDIEIIKQSFYDRQLISSREIAKFRNNLSWRYRIYQWLEEPKSIFESQYKLLFLNEMGIKQTSIYAARRQELEQLRGIRLAVTLAYETRDAIAPRLRATVAWAGKGVVYVLTQVIGRSIGLVVRGVIQGIGSTLQETRFGKNGERGK
jgi:DNA-binding NarL/FixJ family response regulator